MTQDTRRRVTNCFVALEAATEIVAGFYTISGASIPTPDLPESITRKLPRYPSLPVIRIGRLAINRRFTRQGSGGALLADAAAKGLKADAAAFAMLVDAKDDTAVAFYEHHGFVRLMSQPRSLFLALATPRRPWPCAEGEAERRRPSAGILDRRQPRARADSKRLR